MNDITTTPVEEIGIRDYINVHTEQAHIYIAHELFISSQAHFERCAQLCKQLELNRLREKQEGE